MIKRGKISIRKAGHRAVEMAQWPNSGPCHTSMRTYPGTLPMLGSQRKGGSSGLYWSISLAEQVSSKLKETPCLKNRVEHN